MSSFEPISDSAFSLRTEAQDIKVSFKKGVPSVGQGTVEWTIPTPAQGCDSTNSAYAGAIILLSNEPLDLSNSPTNGKIYTPDSSADYDLHVGDRIGNALVVGAFYECEKKSNNEQLTTSLIINDIKSDKPYYIAVYAVDCQYRYHREGVRAYSDVYGDNEINFPATQTVSLGGKLPSDGTGLVPGVDYEFDLIIDDSYPNGNNAKTIEITIDGIEAGTFQELVDAINKRILLVNNPLRSPEPPNSGSFYWDKDEEKLYQFDGTNYNEITNLLLEPSDPSNVQMGTYWFDETTKTLKRWNIPNPIGWNDITHYVSSIDPANPSCDLYWFNGSIARKWDGNIWCERETLISLTDPSDCPTLECGTYWFDKNNNILSFWDDVNLKWTETTAIYWHESPNNLSDGTYWFDDLNNKLYVRVPNKWNDITSSTKIQEEEPSIKIDGMLWYKPSVEELYQFNASSSPQGWIQLQVLVWDEDPTDIKSCNLWWDSVNDTLNSWNVVNNSWEQVLRFIQSENDPSQVSPIVTDTMWFNPSTNELKRWDGGDWLDVEYIYRDTDPTNINFGESWYNPNTNEWFIWDTPNSGWNKIDPINSPKDPGSIDNGTYWFDSTNNALYVRNGTTWITVSFSTSKFTPKKYTEWYNTVDDVLYVWNGEEWIIATPIASVDFNSQGNIVFTTIGKGSNNIIFIPTPEGSSVSTSPCSIGTGYGYHGVNDINAAQCEYSTAGFQKTYPVRNIPENSFLWSNLNAEVNILKPISGNDGKSNVPSYMELGVGDDGTPDERRELIDSIRRQLGYPVVEVELTNYQLDNAVTIALETFRAHAGASVRRGFYFLDIEPGKQKYLLTNKALGYNKIVNVTAAFRFTSAFLSSAHGAGVYGQVVLQHLYNMGTFDLTSFHLVSEYIEQLEHLFATRLVFSWHETDRVLSFHTSFVRPERVLLDTMIERTEQDLLKDRYTKRWIERYTLAEAMLMLSQIRGKFASLPGAGGGISLNASELAANSEAIKQELMQQIDDYVVDKPEDAGIGSAFILG